MYLQDGCQPNQISMTDIESIHGIKDDIYTNNYTQVVQTMNAHLHIIGCICCDSDDADSGPYDDSGSSGPYGDGSSSGSYDDSSERAAIVDQAVHPTVQFRYFWIKWSIR